MSARKRLIQLSMFVPPVCFLAVGLTGEATAQSVWQKMKQDVLQQQCQQGLQKACQSLAQLKQKQAQQAAQQTGQPQTQSPPSGKQQQGQPAADVLSGNVAATAPAESAGPQTGGSQEPWAPPTADATPSKHAGPQAGDSPSAQPWTAPAMEGAPGMAGPLDPMKLPDVQGLHPGMTVEQANQAIAKVAPGARIPWYNSAMYLPASNIVAGHAASQVTVQYDWIGVGGGAKNYKLQLALEATRPPNQEYVWHIGLRAQLQYINRAVLIEALRKKYGKELAATDFHDQSTTDESRIANLWWAFDEQGRPKSPAPAMVNGSPNGCGDPGYELSSLARYGSGGGGSSSSGKDVDPGCMWVGVRATIPYPAEIVTYYFLSLWDAPLSVREQKATEAWLQVQLVKARQDALQKSKEAKPTL